MGPAAAMPRPGAGQSDRRGPILGSASPVEKDMRLRYVGVVLLPSLLAGCSEHAGPPLAPTPENRLQGTYTLTAATSPSCEFQGSWMFRADITQSGRDLQVKLWKLNGDSICVVGSYERCQFSFHGQDNPDGVLFLPDSDQMLFASGEHNVWFYRFNRGMGHAFGQYVDGRIEALYDGQVWSRTGNYENNRHCYASNHPLTFVRR